MQIDLDEFTASDRPTPFARLLLAHGAGAGMQSPFMRTCARELALRGVEVMRFDFPYMRAGRKTPDRAPVLEADFIRQAVEWSRTQDRWRAGDPSSRVPLLIGGKSMGGRIATHLGASLDRWPDTLRPAGVVVFGYPLQPPSRGNARAASDRVSHLHELQVPTLLVQGTRDSFGGPADLELALEGSPARHLITIVPVNGADHSLEVRRGKGSDPDAGWTAIFDAVAGWIGDQ